MNLLVGNYLMLIVHFSYFI